MATAEIVLKLSGREATVLRQLCSRVSGDPDGPRGCMDSISASLSRLGVSRSTEEIVKIEDGVNLHAGPLW